MIGAHLEGEARGGELIDTVSVNLTVNFSTTAQPPVYTTLHTLSLTTVRASSYLAILLSSTALILGASTLNNAPNWRVRLNGTLLVPNGVTVNMIRSRIMPVTFTRRIVVSAGVQTVVVEVAYFGPAGQSFNIQPATLPDLMHSHLTLQEQES